MKKVEAIIRLSKFEDVKEALEAIGVNFFTYLEVSGHGKQKGDVVTYRGAVYDSGDIPRLKLEIVIPDAKVDQLIDTIVTHGRSGSIGDGKIIVSPIEQFVRIRTGERDAEAL
ncbi:MAG: P-II family nitrogen regulator [Bacteroidota bacterium]